MKILMVCLGNICRSPLAEGILREKTKHLDIYVDSAGTAAYHIGEKPDERSIEVAKNYNIDIANLKARQFSKKDFKHFDRIYAMDISNYNNILLLSDSKSDEDKVSLILDEQDSRNSQSIPDPYYGGEKGFESVYSMLEEVCEIIKQKLEKR